MLTEQALADGMPGVCLEFAWSFHALLPLACTLRGPAVCAACLQTMTKEQKDELASAEKALAWMEVRL